jgi:HsdM-like protein
LKSYLSSPAFDLLCQRIARPIHHSAYYQQQVFLQSCIPEENRMSHGNLNWIANFIWGIADDVLRDVYVRGKYRDVILPMTVIRRLDAVLEPTKQGVLDRKKWLDDAGITYQDVALCQASSQAFYNTSLFTLRDLRGCLKSRP